MQARLESQREIRLDWRRRSKREPMARAWTHSCVQSDVFIQIRQPADGNDAGGTEPKGPDLPGGSHAVRQGHARYRQALQVKRAPASYRISRTRPRSRKSSYNCRLIRNQTPF